MAKRLYVGGLPYSVNEGQLKEMFAQAGNVANATVITDRYSGQSKGFGFIEMATDEEANKAIEMLNGKEIEGRTIVVNEARPMEERKPGGFRGGNGGSGGFGGRSDRDDRRGDRR